MFGLSFDWLLFCGWCFSDMSKKKLTLKDKAFGILAICLALLALYIHNLEDAILSYPEQYRWWLFLGLAVVMVLFNIKGILGQTKIHPIEKGLNVLFYIFVAFMLSYILIWPLNEYIIIKSHDSKIEVLDLEITNYKIPRRSLIDFEYKGRSERIYTSSKDLFLLKEAGKDAFWLRLSVRKGPFDTYVVSSWRLQEKPDVIISK